MRPYSKPRHIWRALYPMLLYLGISVLVTLLCMVGYGVAVGFRAASGGDMPFDVDRLMADLMQFAVDGALWMQLAACLLVIAIFTPMWRATHRTHRRYNTGRLSLATALLVTGAAIGLCLLLTVLLEWTDLVRFFPSYELLNEVISRANLPAQILTVCIAAPVAEELCYRGVTLNRLSAWLPDWAAVLISSALFGLMHMNLLQGLYAVLIGAYLSLTYIRTRNIWTAILGHIVFNSTSILLSAVLTALNAEPPAWAVFLPAAVLAVVCVVPLARSQPRLLAESNTENAVKSVMPADSDHGIG